MLQDREDALKDEDKRVNGILREARRNNDKDLLSIEALSSDIQNQERLLVQHGQYLLTLNDQLAANRKMVAQKVDISKINTDASLQSIEQRNNLLQSQSTSNLQSVADHNQQIRDHMDNIEQKLDDDKIDNGMNQQVANQHQKQADQQAILQQRIADQELQLHDTQDR